MMLGCRGFNGPCVHYQYIYIHLYEASDTRFVQSCPVRMVMI